MAKDVIARLKADTSQWDSGLAKATRSLNKFRQNNMSLDAALQGSVKTLTSVAAKYVGWGAAITGAMKVAKDAFKRNEAQLDEWQGFVRASESVYGGFLEALNNGDISGYLNNVNAIIGAARDAYDALDELGTFQAFNQVNTARDKANYQEALDNYRLNPSADNRKALEAANQKVIQNLKDESLLAQDAYKEALESAAVEGGLRGEDVNTFVKMFQYGAYRDFKKLKDRYKEEGGIMGIGGKTMFDGKEVTSVRGRGYWKESGTTLHKGQQVNTSIKDMSKAENSVFLVARSLYNINDDTIKELQRLGADAYNLEEAVSQQNRSYHRLSGQNKTTTPKTPKATKPEEVFGAGELGALEKQIQDLQKAQKHAAITEECKAYEDKIKQINAQIDFLKTGIIQLPTVKPKFDKAASDELKREIQSAGIFSTSSLSALKSSYQDTANNAQIGSRQQTDATAMVADITAFENIRAKFQELGMQMGNDVTNNLLQKIGSGEGVEDADWQTFIDTLNAKIEEIGGELQPISIEFGTGNIENVKKSVVGLDKNVNGVATAFTAMGNALNQIGDPGAKVAGYIASAIGQTAAAFGTAQTQAATMGPWAWIAFAATGLATMVSTIVGIKNATKFADGGQVKGSSFVGDQIPAMLNAGEIVLNYSQQQNLADNLEARELATGGENIIRGEELVTIINNYGRRSGRGEILR